MQHIVNQIIQKIPTHQYINNIKSSYNIRTNNFLTVKNSSFIFTVAQKIFILLSTQLNFCSLRSQLYYSYSRHLTRHIVVCRTFFLITNLFPSNALHKTQACLYIKINIVRSIVVWASNSRRSCGCCCCWHDIAQQYALKIFAIRFFVDFLASTHSAVLMYVQYTIQLVTMRDSSIHPFRNTISITDSCHTVAHKKMYCSNGIIFARNRCIFTSRYIRTSWRCLTEKLRQSILCFVYSWSAPSLALLVRWKI